MTRPSAKPAPLTLSREMKLLLVLLLLAALIGGWYVWTSGRSAGQLAQTPPATPTTEPPAEGTAEDPAAASGNTGAAPAGSVNVQPDGQVDVPTLPAFGAAGASDPAAPQPETAPTPGGINPDTALAALPSVNPFRPLALTAGANGAAGQTPTTPPAAGSRPAAPLDVPRSQPSSPVVSPAAGSQGGALALSPLPGSGDRVTVDAPAVTGGAFPVPTLPGANRPGPEPETVTLVPPAPTGTPPHPAKVTPISPAPVRPPVVGVRVPRENIDLNSTLGRALESRAPGQDSPAGRPNSAGALPTALPTPGVPQPITQLGGDSAAPLPALDQLVQSRDLAFDAVVLGPVNTAIFRSRDGFLVVSVGQRLPDSDVTLKEVTATSATLALGHDTKTLELDKR
ncbi:hypothetical protein E5F05_17140 [Deinococcus metallilatus]|uniref:Uncharacterized protein n=1 Tax=Deinococcus metallilatus TaxID=1211322 RepID=A0AAJ5F9U2_9DEIO|nr:hypothetical protein [Deinococcus metallilatus]MBB5294762.1 hypothetical protein [Deinococcus metallilatus]QBY09513.1 hypothetical protein E5F05_17140 [Deinococcus metallilatus]RXJ09518.1 hypothetical protein ERJ73_15980 [Deinococcus metallilatus]TLK29040.1 hypothetical protein FCS05_07745 [Deinococcus metallilatus]GMA16688.1 hypothetical protein GCM10025871_30190 [Deinococcus metallilatus]